MERTLPLHRGLLVTLGALALVPLACGGSKNEPPPASAYGNTTSGQPQPGGPQTGPAPAGTMGGAPQQNVAGSQPPPGGAPGGAAPGGAAPGGPAPATTGAPPPAGGAPTDAVVVALLSPLAAKYAPGMQPEGAPITANLAEGGHTQTTVTMTAGKCYTIVGASAPVGGVQNLNLKLLAPPFYTVSAGESSSKKSDATIGAAPSPTCPMVPIPVAYKLDVWSSKGAGPVAVQVYSKTK